MLRLVKWLSSVAALAVGAIAVAWLLQRDWNINTRVTIAAPAGAVWRVLNDFSRYPEWNPHLRAMDGRPRPYSRTRFVEIFPDGGEALRRIHMKSMKRDYEFIWEADIAPLPGLLSGKRKLIMTPDPQGGTNLRHEIEFRGLLSGPLMRGLFADYAQSMAAMNAALRERVERND